MHLVGGRRVRIAVAITLGGVALGQLGLWLYARTEGGVLPLPEYLLEVFGVLVLAQAVGRGARRLDRRTMRRLAPADAAPRSAEVRFRRPTDADHPALIGRMNEWWGGRKMQQLFPRLWLQHFTATSWIAEDADGPAARVPRRLHQPDHPDEAYVHLIATDPNRRGRGLGRALYERFFEDARARGADRVTAIDLARQPDLASASTGRWGSRPDDGPARMHLYGTRAYPDYDADGEDRVVFSPAAVRSAGVRRLVQQTAEPLRTFLASGTSPSQRSRSASPSV